jgi:small ligand-binding sensory domain FIST
MTGSPPPPTAASPLAAASISGHLDTRTAATEIAGDLVEQVGDSCDLAFLFGSFHHRAAFAEAAEAIRQTIAPATMLGVTAESVLGVDRELEGLAGMAAIAFRLPGVRLNPWSFNPERDLPLLDDADGMRRHLGLDDELRAVIMLADPFSTPIARLLPTLANSGADGAPVPVVGGLSSGASQPGHNALALDDRVVSMGAIGVTVAGPIGLDIVVSQGCRAIGRPVVITKAQSNVIHELGGTPAVEVIRRMTSTLSEQERALMSSGLLVGTVINEYKERFGRGDFLIRNILGVDQKHGAIAVGDVPRVGQTVQFHVRDAETAHEDLQLLLDAQQLQAPPLGGLLFSCNGRGSRLFNDAHHDIRTIRERLGEIPLAGFFAAGEFGPIGDRSFLHGHTASLAVFRSG